MPADDSSDAFSRRSDFTENESCCDDDKTISLHKSKGSHGIKTQPSHIVTSPQEETIKDISEEETITKERVLDDNIKNPGHDIEYEEIVEKSVESKGTDSTTSEIVDEAVPEDRSNTSIHGPSSPKEEKSFVESAKPSASRFLSSNSAIIGEDSSTRPPNHEKDSISERLMIDGVIGNLPVCSNTSFRRGSMEGSVVSGNRFRTPSEEEKLAGMLQNALDVDELLSDLNEMDHAYLESLRPLDSSSIHSTDFSLSYSENDEYNKDVESQMVGSEHWEDMSQVSVPTARKKKKKKRSMTKMTKPSMFRPHSSNALATIEEKRVEKKPTYTRKKVIVLIIVVVAGGVLAAVVIFVVKLIESGTFTKTTISTKILEKRKLMDYYVVGT